MLKTVYMLQYENNEPKEVDLETLKEYVVDLIHTMLDGYTYKHNRELFDRLVGYLNILDEVTADACMDYINEVSKSLRVFKGIREV